MGMEKKKVYRLKFKIELYNNGRRVLDTYSSKKTKIVRSAQVKPYENGLLKIMLGNRRNVINEAIFCDTAELKKAISILTEKKLIKYIGGKDGEGI
jgi:hypothetical protein